MDLQVDIESSARYWASSESFDSETRQEVARLIEDRDTNELSERFYKELEFGTGGMRGIMGAGTARMNVYNIRKATTALARYLGQVFKGQELRVAISYDSRINSQEYAQAAAAVLAAHGIRALITSEMRPTPLLSFMVRYFGCHAGICVTASHNPPEYNGFKVYWQTGGQLIPPHDSRIIEIYQSIAGYDGLESADYEEAVAAGQIQEVGDELDEAYFQEIERLSFHPNTNDDFKIVYSPIHGTGIYCVPAALELFGFPSGKVVGEQALPDGTFPTVSSPNPEDPQALALAIELAEAEDADLVLATDPDTDRIAVVARDAQGRLQPLNGNQLGSLLNYYVLSSLHELDEMPENPLIIKTIVTTDLQADIARSFGVHCDETLTGFKWICDRIEGYESGAIKPFRQFLCGGEESYGFLAGTFVRDKDAVLGCALAAEMTSFYQSQGKTLFDVLDELFTQHGVYQESLRTYVLAGRTGAEKIAQIMEQFRSEPPQVVAGIAIERISDWQLDQVHQLEGGTRKLIGKTDLPKSNVLQFQLRGGSKISIRPSGTEPKIKVYFSFKDARVGLEGGDLQAAKDEVLATLSNAEETFARMIDDC